MIPTPDLASLGLFVLAVLLLTPGPAVLYIVARSIESVDGAGARVPTPVDLLPPSGPPVARRRIGAARTNRTM